MSDELIERQPRYGSAQVMHWVHEAVNRVRELEAERDALRRDAERYRWLRGGGLPHLCVREWQRLTPARVSQPDSCVRDDKLDAVIDAALGLISDAAAGEA